MEMGWGRDMDWGSRMSCVREIADALWEGHILLKTGVLTDIQK